MEPGQLVAEYARQARVLPQEFAGELTRLLAPAGESLPVPTASNRSVWDSRSGSSDAAARQDISVRAEAELGSPWPLSLASAASRVHRDGNRDAWEHVAFARQRRLSRAAVTATITLDDRWIDEVADGVWLLCEQSSWCWPAHDDTRAKYGSVLATSTDPFLDLGAGEVVAQLAWVDHLLGEQLDARYPGLRDRIRHEARVRVLDPFITRRDWHWLGLDGDAHNWNPWIHGNVLVAALRLMDNSAERAEVIALVIEGIDRYLAVLPGDGAIDEGYGYWWNGACRALEALDLIAHATGGRLDGSGIPVLRATVAFPHSVHLGGPWYLNFSDSQARPSGDQPWHALHRAASRVGDDNARAHAASHRLPGQPAASEAEGLGRLLRGMSDEAWIAAAAEPAPLPREVWLGSTHVLVARETAGSSAGLTLAVKGGHNDENHNHNDVGSFIVASDGVPVIVDAGRPTYTAQTFGPDRYSIWTMQSSWHSVPEIRGTAQGTGREFAAAEVNPTLGSEATGLGLELRAAYPVPELRSWRRSVRLERADTPTVVVEDTWRLDPWTGAGDELPTTIRMLIAGSVQLEAGAARVTPLEGATPVVLRWPPGAEATLLTRQLDDPILSTVWGPSLHRIDIDVTGLDALRVTAELDTPITGDER